jgi:uncharacterized lipoprotein
MKRMLVLFALSVVILAACGPKPYYKTAEGKRKQKYYNAIQFGQKERPKMKF